MEIIYSLAEIAQTAKELLAQNPAKVILFNGEMGAGKTTFIKAICNELGVEKSTSSPTFSLVNEYKTVGGALIYHFDVYRLKDEHEALDIGIDDYLHSGNWCFIEWAEKIPNLLPDKYSIIDISQLPHGNRKISLTNI